MAWFVPAASTISSPSNTVRSNPISASYKGAKLNALRPNIKVNLYQLSKPPSRVPEELSVSKKERSIDFKDSPIGQDFRPPLPVSPSSVKKQSFLALPSQTPSIVKEEKTSRTVPKKTNTPANDSSSHFVGSKTSLTTGRTPRSSTYSRFRNRKNLTEPQKVEKLLKAFFK